VPVSAQTLFILIVAAWLAIAVAVFAALFFVTAPYGRYARGGWGPTLPSRFGWLTMEAPAALVFAAVFAVSPYRGTTAWVFLVMWELHYVYRAFVYPFTLREDRRMPLSVVGMAIVFNSANAWLNAWWLFDLSGGYATSWLADPRFVAGAALFLVGMIVTRRADAVLRGLRSGCHDGYQVPQGGLYRWVSCPNYLGEIVEWAGWALATWSLPGLAFAAWTAANLAPRARANHLWYREHFSDYPPDRRALIPGIW
jgi:3-oxo-5-alpha-steroid 4-dehydrogenase 1